MKARKLSKDFVVIVKENFNYMVRIRFKMISMSRKLVEKLY